jgi:hypothetical protein
MVPDWAAAAVALAATASRQAKRRTRGETRMISRGEP